MKIKILLIAFAVICTFGCKKSSFNEETHAESLIRRGFMLENRGKIFNEYRKGDSITLLKRGAENTIVSKSFHGQSKYYLDAGSCIMSGLMAQESDDYVDDLGAASDLEGLSIKLDAPGMTSVSYTAGASEHSLHGNYISLYDGYITFTWGDSSYNTEWLLDRAADACVDESFKKIF